uniref:NmrA-like domain-containing protein n=1 Tax=Dicranema revolutum TaxID=239144 RepID=A0A4D6WUA4_9FLOR|nr:hypothetical protein [Dicranema revolutum]
MSLLILGGTGTLGCQIVKRALDEGFQVKCLVRNFRKAAFLKEWGAEIIYGDLKSPETIPMTLVGITAIIDASTARPYDNIKEIDLRAKYILIESAKKARVKRYIFFSVLNAHKYPNIPLMSIKLKIEDKLISSGLNYTIFTIAGLFQGLINQYALPILEQQPIWVTKKTSSIAYIDTQDVAKYTIKSLSILNTIDKTLPLVGNYSWEALEVIKLCEKISGQQSKISQVPIYLLKLARKFTNFFQYTWNISDRLAFTEIITKGDELNIHTDHAYNLLQINTSEIISLESYMQEYFTKIMKKLKALNYTADSRTNNVEF